MSSSVAACRRPSRWISVACSCREILYDGDFTGISRQRFLTRGSKFPGPVGFLGRFKFPIPGPAQDHPPGVPDFYQGTELWDLSLVDPDNRRPVDFHLRMELLNKLRKTCLSFSISPMTGGKLMP